MSNEKWQQVNELKRKLSKIKKVITTAYSESYCGDRLKNCKIKKVHVKQKCKQKNSRYTAKRVYVN